METQYQSIMQPTDVFNRQLVSYQANKNTQMHRWFKYKEGFSAKLVRKLLSDFKIQHPQQILDPFAGVSTTLLVAQELGLNATGIEVMPIGEIVWRAKSNYLNYDLRILKSVRDWVEKTPPQKPNHSFPHVPITRYAFDTDQEAKLMWYDEQFRTLSVGDEIKTLLRFILMSILEDVSYTSKDGQYLRWDSRSEKVKKRDQKRISNGKKSYKTFHKRQILDATHALLEAINQIIFDIEHTPQRATTTGQQQLIQGTVLDVLPTLESNSFDGVITSPPYCNRYDYTRTYALELAFLGVDEQSLLELRQTQLSCTVENKSKIQMLRSLYSNLDRLDDFTKIMSTVQNHEVLNEILDALRQRASRNELNNKGIISMIEGYFTELAFVTYELFRVCKSDASIAIINDNVRYSGEIIPVDLLMTDIATQFGFTTDTIYVLPQRKGNSSQQMGKYGREALRKSILIWEKH